MRAVLYCLLFLALAEAGLMWVDSAPQGQQGQRGPQGPVWVTDRPVLLNLGSSRTRAGLSPDLIGAVIAAGGVDDPWVANIWGVAATNVGLYIMYMEQVSDWARRVRGRGIVAIEVRGSAMNDGYLSPSEEVWLSKSEEEDQEGTVAGDWAQRLFWTQLSTGNLDGAARRLLWWSRLSRSRDYLERLGSLLVDRTGAERSPSSDLFEYLRKREWGRDGHGWNPVPKRKPIPSARAWQDRYRNLLLKDYRMGGVQTRFLRMLIRRVKLDGFEPALFIMPITEQHHGFYQRGEFQAFLEHLHQLGCEEGVEVFDFDSGHEIDSDLFRDTHHLTIDGAKMLSEQIARELYLPLLRDDGAKR